MLKYKINYNKNKNAKMKKFQKLCKDVKIKIQIKNPLTLFKI